MKQKVVIKVQMPDERSRSKAHKIAFGQPGVTSAAIEGNDKDQITVIGEEFDPFKLTTLLRKSLGSADIISVSKMDEMNADFSAYFSIVDQMKEERIKEKKEALLTESSGSSDIISVSTVDEMKEEKMKEKKEATVDEMKEEKMKEKKEEKKEEKKTREILESQYVHEIKEKNKEETTEEEKTKKKLEEKK